MSSSLCFLDLELSCRLNARQRRDTLTGWLVPEGLQPPLSIIRQPPKSPHSQGKVRQAQAQTGFQEKGLNFIVQPHPLVPILSLSHPN